MSAQLKCQCQDSSGNVCNRLMSAEEYELDGMCDACACHVFDELFNDGGEWYHGGECLEEG